MDCNRTFLSFLFPPSPPVPQTFTPLVLKCKQLGRAMRIGTNHGSLSDRIMSYYGDSPRGMVSVTRGVRGGGERGGCKNSGEPFMLRPSTGFLV